MATAARQEGVEDEIDRLSEEELEFWESSMLPMLNPIRALAKSATSYDDFQAKLAKMSAAKKMDAQELVDTLATLTFEARGLGSATDDVVL